MKRFAMAFALCSFACSSGSHGAPARAKADVQDTKIADAQSAIADLDYHGNDNEHFYEDSPIDTPPSDAAAQMLSDAQGRQDGAGNAYFDSVNLSSLDIPLSDGSSATVYLVTAHFTPAEDSGDEPAVWIAVFDDQGMLLATGIDYLEQALSWDDQADAQLFTRDVGDTSDPNAGDPSAGDPNAGT
jgi:hypothetical protein